MNTVVTRNLPLSRFDIHVDWELAGFADYKLKDGVIVFPHTEIDPKFGGKGLGTTLIEFALNEVVKEKLSVEPLCPFVSKYIGKHPELLHLVPEEKRKKFGLQAWISVATRAPHIYPDVIEEIGRTSKQT